MSRHAQEVAEQLIWENRLFPPVPMQGTNIWASWTDNSQSMVRIFPALYCNVLSKYDPRLTAEQGEGELQLSQFNRPQTSFPWRRQPYSLKHMSYPDWERSCGLLVQRGRKANPSSLWWPTNFHNFRFNQAVNSFEKFPSRFRQFPPTIVESKQEGWCWLCKVSFLYKSSMIIIDKGSLD